jgi:hypothetical protein
MSTSPHPACHSFAFLSLVAHRLATLRTCGILYRLTTFLPRDQHIDQLLPKLLAQFQYLIFYRRHVWAGIGFISIQHLLNQLLGSRL